MRIRKYDINERPPTRVYLMYNDLKNLWKIGCSFYPIKRLKTIRHDENNESIYLIAWTDPVPTYIEQAIQKKYKPKHAYKEWYDLSHQEAREIVEEYQMNRNCLWCSARCNFKALRDINRAGVVFLGGPKVDAEAFLLNAPLKQ